MKIALLDGISPETVRKNLPSFVPVSLVEEPEAIILRSSTKLKKVDELPSSLRAICRAGSGTENIPVEWCSSRGIPVFNTPGANANAVKEMVLCALFLSSRNVIPALEFVKDHIEVPNVDWEKEKKKFRGEEIFGKKILIIGLGNVGCLVAESTEVLGMTVYGYDPYSVRRNTASVHSILSSLNDSRVGECDFITLHPSLTDETRDLIGREFLSRVKQGVKIINFARKEMVDADALDQALGCGHVQMYICDSVDLRFYPSPDQILLFPHLGAETKEAQDAAIKMATKQIEDFWFRGTIKNSVNFPKTRGVIDSVLSHYVRFIICNINIPGAVASCANVLNKHSLNIVSFINKSRGNVGYNIFDVEVSGERRESIHKILEEMRENKAITQARVII